MICSADLPEGLMEVMMEDTINIPIHYRIMVNGCNRHYPLDGHGVMRAMAFYIQGLSYKLDKSTILT